MEQFHEQLKNISGVQIKVTPLYNTLVTGLQQNIPVLFQIMGGKMSTEIKRRSINIAIVLDRSGSMKGSKLENSKKAIKQLIGLLGSEDRIHFVVYDSVVNTIFSNVTCRYVKDSLQKIDSVCDGDCTDLLAGVQRGVYLVKKYSTEGTLDAVFLFSDGLANSGVQDIETIGGTIKTFYTDYNIHFTTFGIGDDFNEILMSSIARCGKGNYFYIDDMERIPTLVLKAYNGFVNILAEDLNLKVQGVNESVLTELEGCTDFTKGREFRVMREYGFYQLLAKITVPAKNVSDDIAILSYQLTFTDLKDNSQSICKSFVNIKIIEESKITLTRAPAVVCYQVMLECGEINNQINDYVKKYNRNKVLKLKKQVISKYKEVIDLDKFGFIASLLSKECTALEILVKEGLCAHTSKTIAYTNSAPGRRSQSCSYENNEEDDCDLGYGLFD